MKRSMLVTMTLVGIMSLGGCMGMGGVMLGEAVDDMVVDVIPGDAPPEFNVPFVGDLHDVDWAWGMLLPWTWFNYWGFSPDEEEETLPMLTESPEVPIVAMNRGT